MARRLSGRLRVSGRLVATSALHVGGGSGDHAADLVPAVDGSGAAYIPGTSLAGALRAWAARNAPPADRRAVDAWGSPDAASTIFVDDAPIEGATVRERRDGVGVDRVRGVAARRTKFDRVVLARGTSFALSITAELPVNAQAEAGVRRLLFETLHALQAGDVSLGAAQTRGLGSVKLHDLLIREERLDRDGILADLGAPNGDRGIGCDLAKLVDPTAAPAERSWSTIDMLVLSVSWKPDGPVMVAAGSDGVGVDSYPLTARSVADDALSLLLPGSSVKGALRTRAERIVRTVLDLDIAPGQAHHRQVDVPLVDVLFGLAGRSKDDTPRDHGVDRAPAERLGRGALAVCDCHSEQKLNAAAWHSAIAAATAKAAQASARKAGLPSAAAAMHVAIDRWTGGAADGALYSVLEPTDATWEPIELRIDLRRLPEPTERRAALVLLWLVLRDLRAGELPLGFAINRGMGAVTGVRVDVEDDPGDEVGALFASTEIAAIPAVFRDAWRDWHKRTEDDGA